MLTGPSLLLWVGLASFFPPTGQPSTFPHPHFPHAVRMAGAGGEVAVTYFTVPYNEKHLEGLRPGFQWHLGFAGFQNKVPIKSGNVTVPPGRFKLDAKRGEKENEWSIVLTPFEVWRAKRMGRRRGGRGSGAEGIKRAIEAAAKKGLKAEYVLPASTFKAKNEEHLVVYSIHRGYATTRMGSITPRSGMKATVRVSFGDLHQQFSFTEVYPAEKAGDGEKPTSKPKRRGF